VADDSKTTNSAIEAHVDLAEHCKGSAAVFSSQASHCIVRIRVSGGVNDSTIDVLQKRLRLGANARSQEKRERDAN